jgi:peptidoglycan glycosyltransferase
MKRLKTRAISTLLLVAIAVTGMGVYIVRFAADGGRWATAFSTQHSGTVTDRNGVMLASAANGYRTFADNADTRKANLHSVGDMYGFIGTGALTVFAPRLTGYNHIFGTYSGGGEGGTVTLTIDSRLNAEAYKALNGRKGAVMVMNYETGEVLCMVSSPSYDPANPPGNIDDPKYEGAYINRAVSSVYTPGSVYKLMTAAAALENIPGADGRVFTCGGSYRAGDGDITCPSSHGSLDLKKAVAVSCNGFFAELSLELGADTLARYAKMYGLTEPATVGGITTAAGNFEKAAAGTSALAWSGIGQYTNTVCPAAMLRFSGAIANGGIAVPIRLTPQTGLSLPGGRIMREDTSNKLDEMMNHHDGSFSGLKMRAKSGTAEVGGGLKPHAWFTGYIRNGDAPLAFVVIVENGGSGTAVAGEVAGKVLQAARKNIL